MVKFMDFIFVLLMASIMLCTEKFVLIILNVVLRKA